MTNEEGRVARSCGLAHVARSGGKRNQVFVIAREPGFWVILGGKCDNPGFKKASNAKPKKTLHQPGAGSGQSENGVLLLWFRANSPLMGSGTFNRILRLQVAAATLLFIAASAWPSSHLPWL